MKEMQIFENQEFGAVRTVELDGEPWLVGKDVAQALGYSNPRKALADHVDEEDKGVTKCDTLGGVQEMTIINESGLYSLVLSSKLPGAKKFRRWVTAEVLPAVRKHGAYMTPHTLEQALLSPDFLLRLAQRLKGAQGGGAGPGPPGQGAGGSAAKNRLLQRAGGAEPASEPAGDGKAVERGGKGIHPLAAGKPVPVPGEERETATLCHAAQQRMLRGKGMV